MLDLFIILSSIDYIIIYVPLYTSSVLELHPISAFINKYIICLKEKKKSVIIYMVWDISERFSRFYCEA